MFDVGRSFFCKGVRPLTRERQALGKQGEDWALKLVNRLGYRLIERNYRNPLGEIDIIARDGDCLVFMEIKTRRGRSVAYAKEAVDKRKKRTLSKAALAYMKENDCCDAKARFDVVAISIRGDRMEMEVIKNAFDLAY
jgi:putative endonuclease